MGRILTRSTVALAALVVAAGPAVPAADPGRSKQWGLDQVGAPAAWAAGRGKGIVIAVVDSGVDLSHEDLKANLIPGRDLIDGDSSPQDAEGHGTHVAGIAAAVSGNGRGVAGVAPAARIMPVRVLDEDGEGNAGDVAEAIRWAADRGAQVINLSLGDLGEPLFGPAFGDALRYAWSRGAIPVVAAGNEYLLTSGYGDEPAIVVSSTDRADGKPAYSSGVGDARWGMAAPGGAGGPLGSREGNVLSTYPGGYAYMAGTSMAAPHVSGAAALLRSLGLTPQQTVDRLLSTAKDIGAPGRDATFGAGRLDAAAAVAGLRSRRSGSAARTPSASAGSPDVPPASGAAGSPAAAAGGSQAVAQPTAQPGPSTPDVGPGAGRDLPGEEASEGLPMTVWVTGLVTVLLAILIGWTLFRPNPPD